MVNDELNTSENAGVSSPMINRQTLSDLCNQKCRVWYNTDRLGVHFR